MDISIPAEDIINIGTTKFDQGFEAGYAQAAADLQRQAPAIAPCYLATNRGFFCGDGYLPSYSGVTGRLFTSNIRSATPFNSFSEAEDCFKRLYAVSMNHAGKNEQASVLNYFAVLVAPQTAIPVSTETLMASNSNHPANCICPLCLNY